MTPPTPAPTPAPDSVAGKWVTGYQIKVINNWDESIIQHGTPATIEDAINPLMCKVEFDGVEGAFLFDRETVRKNFSRIN